MNDVLEEEEETSVKIFSVKMMLNQADGPSDRGTIEFLYNWNIIR